MRNEGADIVQDHTEDLREATEAWKEKAKMAGTAAWDATKATYHQIQEKSVEYGQATDRVIRGNPYMALCVAFGAGVVLGLFASKSSSRVSNRDCCN